MMLNCIDVYKFYLNVISYKNISVRFYTNLKIFICLNILFSLFYNIILLLILCFHACGIIKNISCTLLRIVRIYIFYKMMKCCFTSFISSQYHWCLYNAYVVIIKYYIIGARYYHFEFRQSGINIKRFAFKI